MRNEVVKIYATIRNYNWDTPFIRGEIKGVTGSGCFITSTGHVLTASHVVVDSITIHIEIPEKGSKKYRAELLGCCPHLDIALLKVVGYKPRAWFKLGNSDRLEIGSKTTAYGFPLGQTNLIGTEGVVSGRKGSMIQMDTPINAGNSGGPLVYKGKVVGINVAAMVGEGISATNYAVPINQFVLIARELAGERALVRRPFIGINYNNGSAEASKAKGTKCEGVLINKVFAGAPIASTGIKEGDILLEMDGYRVDSHGKLDYVWLNSLYDLLDYFVLLPSGKRVTIKYWDGKKVVSANFDLDGYNLPIHTTYPGLEEVDYEIVAGLVLMNLTSNHLKLYPQELSEYFYLNNRAEGAVVVSAVLPGSMAGSIGVFMAGDVVREVNGKKVRDLNGLRRVILGKREQTVSLKNQINEEMIFSSTDIASQNIILCETLRIEPTELTKGLTGS